MSLNDYDMKREEVLGKIFAMQDREKQFLFMHICLAVESKKDMIVNPQVLLPSFLINEVLHWDFKDGRTIDISFINPIGIRIEYRTPNKHLEIQSKFQLEVFETTIGKLCPELGDQIQYHCDTDLIPFIIKGEKQLCH